MTDTIEKNIQDNGVQESRKEENQQMSSGSFREISYVVLFIGAIFVINAMETGSYRTPWPVAIITTLAGIGLFGYSWYLKSHKD